MANTAIKLLISLTILSLSGIGFAQGKIEFRSPTARGAKNKLEGRNEAFRSPEAVKANNVNLRRSTIQYRKPMGTIEQHQGAKAKAEHQGSRLNKYSITPSQRSEVSNVSFRSTATKAEIKQSTEAKQRELTAKAPEVSNFELMNQVGEFAKVAEISADLTSRFEQVEPEFVGQVRNFSGMTVKNWAMEAMLNNEVITASGVLKNAKYQLEQTRARLEGRTHEVIDAEILAVKTEIQEIKAELENLQGEGLSQFELARKSKLEEDLMIKRNTLQVKAAEKSNMFESAFLEVYEGSQFSKGRRAIKECLKGAKMAG